MLSEGEGEEEREELWLELLQPEGVMEEEKLWLVLLLPEGVVEGEKLWLGLTEADPEDEVLCSAEGLCPSAGWEQKLSSSSTGSAAWSSCRKEIMEKKKAGPI